SAGKRSRFRKQPEGSPIRDPVHAPSRQLCRPQRMQALSSKHSYHTPLQFAMCHFQLLAAGVPRSNAPTLQRSNDMRFLGLNISRDIPAPAKKTFTPEQWLRGQELDNGGSVLSNAYQQVVWVYRAINVLAE